MFHRRAQHPTPFTEEVVVADEENTQAPEVEEVVPEVEEDVEFDPTYYDQARVEARDAADRQAKRIARGMVTE